MTPEERQRLRALCDAATPGPWRKCSASDGHCPCGLIMSTSRDTIVCGVADEVMGSEQPQEQRWVDQDFIAASRAAIPALLDALEAAERRYETERAEHEACADIAVRRQLEVNLARVTAELAERTRERDAARAAISSLSHPDYCDGAWNAVCTCGLCAARKAAGL